MKDLTLDQQIVLDFIAAQPLGVFCTINAQGLPEAAVMAVSQTDKLELIFQTPNTTRKYANLQANPHIAVVIGWDSEDFTTVQYEGMVREVVDNNERAECARIHDGKKGPGAKSYSHIPENKFFVVTPTYIRYTDPTRTIELTF
ncbi:MAG TPA: pyridoxamine 5'-phosphate oxidase family protein [Candidatus Saccharimonadales bacterium]|nr:pyridoxamine 5'-phosphate oxidase family protein [Candidatus Saccharimonadales bacterium]